MKLLIEGGGVGGSERGDWGREGEGGLGEGGRGGIGGGRERWDWGREGEGGLGEGVRGE